MLEAQDDYYGGAPIINQGVGPTIWGTRTNLDPSCAQPLSYSAKTSIPNKRQQTTSTPLAACS